MTFHKWIASPTDSDKAPELRLRNAWIANLCGDPECETRRLQAALSVLYGAVHHADYAIAVEGHLDLLYRFNHLRQIIEDVGNIIKLPSDWSINDRKEYHAKPIYPEGWPKR